jgi:response regulator RpfG family c-di-GMP phosphodiesterase
MNTSIIDYSIKNSKILVIDDISENIQLVGNILQNCEFQVLTANSGAQGLKIAEIKNPDLILLDIQMPVMDGYEVILKLKTNPLTSEIPVIFLTAHSDVDDIVKGFESGAADYICKPFQKAELLSRIKYQLSLKYSKELIKQQNIELQKINSELEEAYRKLKEEQDKLLEMERLKSVLAMAVTTSHELNQPLTVIQGSIEMLVIKHPDLETDKHIKKVIESLNDIANKINKFSNFDNILYKEYTEDVDMIGFDDEE